MSIVFKLLLLSTAALSVPAAAQQTPVDPCVANPGDCVTIDDPRVPDPHDIVVTATGVPQGQDQVGQAITVVTRADLETRQTVSIADYLATTPGVTVSRNGGVGGLTSLRIRGAEAEQTLVLIDGVRVNDPSSPGGAFDFGSLLAGSIERVEVLRGSDSVPWGSQAIGGVVNIVTQDPQEGVQARANAEYGYHDTFDGTAAISGKRGAISGALTGGYYRSDGISSAADGTELDGYKQYGGTGRLGIEFAPGIGFDLRGYYAHSRLEFDGFSNSPPFGPADGPQYSKQQEIYGYAGLHANLLDDRLKNHVAFTIADINRDSFDPDFPSLSRGRSERYEYQGDFSPVDKVRIVAGVEHENSRYFDGFAHAATGITSEYGELIVQPVRQLTLTGGVRHDDHRDFGSHTTFGADAALALDEGTTLRASYGEGFKAPTLYQLDSDYGNKTLVPETSRSFDAGIEQSFLAGRARAGVTYFNRQTRNQIDFASCAPGDVTDAGSICFNRPFGVYANIDRARAEGVEFDLALKPIDALTLTANYSYIDSENRSPGADFGNDLARRPKQTVSVSADYRFPFGLSIGGTIQDVGDSFDDAGNFTRLDGYALASVRAELPIGERFSVYGRIENLFDEKYQTVAGYGTYGRAAYGGVRMRFD